MVANESALDANSKNCLSKIGNGIVYVSASLCLCLYNSVKKMFKKLVTSEC